MFVYPYKQIKAGKFTKYAISLTFEGNVLIEKTFRGRRQAQEEFFTAEAIKGSAFPKEIKQAAKWALYDAKGLGLNG